MYLNIEYNNYSIGRICKVTKYIITGATIVIAALVVIFHTANQRHAELIYISAKEAIEQKQWDQAINHLDKIPGYMDVDKQLKHAKYMREQQNLEAIYNSATKSMARKQWEEAINSFEQITNYKDAESKLKYAKVMLDKQENEKAYNSAIRYIANKQWQQAINILKYLGDYKDAKARLAYALKKLSIAEEQRIHQERMAQQAIERAEALAEKRTEENRLLGMVNGKRSAYRKLIKLRNNHPEWSDEDCATIAQRSVQIGFTREQAIAAWGRPRDINRTTGEWGINEQWVYGEYDINCLYFDNGILTSIQN